MCPDRSVLHRGHMCGLLSEDGGLAGAAALAGLFAAAEVPAGAGSGAAATWAPEAVFGAGAPGLGAGCVPEALPVAHAPQTQLTRKLLDTGVSDCS